MPGEGLTPEAAEWDFARAYGRTQAQVDDIALALARQRLAAEARGREAAAQEVELMISGLPGDMRLATAAARIRTLAPAAPKAAPPADAQDALREVAVGLLAACEEFLPHPDYVPAVIRARAMGLARSAPPAPAAPTAPQDDIDGEPEPYWTPKA